MVSNSIPYSLVFLTSFFSLSQADDANLPPYAGVVIERLQEFEDQEKQRYEESISAKRKEAITTLEEYFAREMKVGNLVGALEIRRHIELLGGVVRDPSLEEPPLVEDFDGKPSRHWACNPNLRINGGFAETRGGTVWIETKEEISGDFELTVDLVRDGTHLFDWWDFGIAFVDTGIVCGLRLAKQNEDLVFVTTDATENVPGKPWLQGVKSFPIRSEGTQRGQWQLTRKENRISLTFISESGQILSTPSLAIPENLSAKIRVVFDGVNTTPRKIDRIQLRAL